METVDNNQFEVKPTSKRKIAPHSTNVYLNPALDLLANEDPMCNTAMEITPNKRRKRTSCNITAFENTALDLGISKAAVNEFLLRELENVRKNVRNYETPIKLPPKPLSLSLVPRNDEIEPIYANLGNEPCLPEESLAVTCSNNVLPDNSLPLTSENTLNENISNFDNAVTDIEMDSGISVLDQKSSCTNGFENIDISAINTTNIQANVTNQIIVNNSNNLSLSFIDRLALDSPSVSPSLNLDDDLNESNIMEIKTITIITKKKLVSTKKNTNPFLDPNLDVNVNNDTDNPFLDANTMNPELEYDVEALSRPNSQVMLPNDLVPRRLFAGDTNSTISTVNDSANCEANEYENIDHYRAESPIYENIGDDTIYNKQSKILGCDVSQFSAIDIMNLNKVNHTNTSNESTDSKKDLKKQILKASNKLSKKVFKTLKKTFKGEKIDNNITLNPYEVPRKVPKQKIVVKDSGIENPALNLDNSDDIEIEEIDDEHQYETIKTIRNTRLNMNVTPLKERVNENMDVSNKTNTPGKKVRFDSTLNREKIITGDSFDCDIQSPGFDAKLDKYHDELENCINERKFLQQNM